MTTHHVFHVHAALSRAGHVVEPAVAHVALATALDDPMQNVVAKRVYERDPDRVVATLRTAPPAEAALMVARLYLAGVGTGEL